MDSRIFQDLNVEFRSHPRLGKHLCLALAWMIHGCFEGGGGIIPIQFDQSDAIGARVFHHEVGWLPVKIQSYSVASGKPSRRWTMAGYSTSSSGLFPLDRYPGLPLLPVLLSPSFNRDFMAKAKLAKASTLASSKETKASWRIRSSSDSSRKTEKSCLGVGLLVHRSLPMRSRT